MRWLSAVVAGVVVVVAAYLIYVPAITYYLPAATGIANRMNVLASVGYVLIVYGSLVLLGTLAFRTRRNGAALVTALGLAGAVACWVLGYIDRVAEDSRRFERAYALGSDVLWRLQDAVPQPPDGATIYSAGQPIEVQPGFPIFGNTWDLEGAARVIWRDYTLGASPYFPGTTMSCGSKRVSPVNPRYDTGSEGAPVQFRSPYGKTVLFNAVSGQHDILESRRECEAAAQWFTPGPEHTRGLSSGSVSSLAFPHPPLQLAGRVGSLEGAPDPYALYDDLGRRPARTSPRCSPTTGRGRASACSTSAAGRAARSATSQMRRRARSSGAATSTPRASSGSTRTWRRRSTCS